MYNATGYKGLVTYTILHYTRLHYIYYKNILNYYTSRVFTIHNTCM